MGVGTADDGLVNVSQLTVYKFQFICLHVAVWYVCLCRRKQA